jgi:hypothetical protein
MNYATCFGLKIHPFGHFVARLAPITTALLPRRLWRSLLAMIVVLVSTVVVQAAGPLPIGTRVEFDKVYASNPELSQWVEGEITSYMPVQNHYKIHATSGTNYTIPNDSRWIRLPGAGAAAAQGAESALSAAPQPAQSVAPQRAPVEAAAGFAAGTRIQFDRAESTVAAGGRWDSGVIMGRAPNNRYKIRGDNGTNYTIQNDPRWILPEGAPLPGPRYDYLDTPLSPAVPEKNASAGTMPPDGLYTVTNMNALHAVGVLEIHGASYRGLEASGPFKALRGKPSALEFTGGLSGLEGDRITGANYMGLSKIGKPVIKIRYVSSKGFNEELEATKEH